MKHLLISLLAATAVTAAFAQAPGTTVKVDPKNNKVGKPVVEKPKVKLLTRDELRFCLEQDRDLTAEAADIKTAEAKIVADRAALKELRTSDDTRDAELTKNAPVLKDDIAVLAKFATDFQADTSLKKDDIKAKTEEYNAKSASLQLRIDEHNKGLQAMRQARAAYNDRADAFTKGLDAHNARVEKHLDKLDAKDVACKNKSYDVADEVAVKKELGLKP